MSDQLTDTLLTTDAAGRIGASFTGKLYAQLGLDLDEGVAAGANPPSGGGGTKAPGYVRWVRQSDGSVAAELYSGEQDAGGANTQTLTIEARGQGGLTRDVGVTLLVNKDAGDATPASLDVRRGVGGGVKVNGGAGVVTLLDSAGASGFARLAALAATSFGFAKAHSTAAFTYTAADTNRRVYAPVRTLDFDSMAAIHATNTYFVAPGAGKYLVLLVIDQITVAGNIMVGAIKNDVTVLRSQTCNCALGTDAGFKGGALMWDIFDLANGDTVKYIGWHSGGGNAVLTLVAVRLPL